MFLHLLLLVAVTVQSQKVPGHLVNGSCVCKISSSAWSFPAAEFVEVARHVESCEDGMLAFQQKLWTTNLGFPSMTATLQNVSARLKTYDYLHTSGQYNALQLRQLNQELEEILTTVNETHTRNPSAETHKLFREIVKVKNDIGRMYRDDFFNLETIKRRFRELNNRAQTCKTIPNDFRGTCHQRLMTSIGSPVVTKVNSFSKSYISGAWGRDPVLNPKERYWEHVLPSGHKHGNTIRIYNSFEDFMVNKNYKDEQIAASYSDKNAVQGSGTVMYDNTVFYQCFSTAEICSFNITTKTTKRVKLDGAGIDNKFPFCYYSCRDWTDIDVEVDRDTVWAIYATEENHGNIVVSRLEPNDLNITHTWKTHLFKRSVTSTFMVCGVLYATRYNNAYEEEVFYAFDTTTGQETNTLSLPFEKVSPGIANLNYNPVDQKLYLYNDAYLLAYNTFF